MWSLDNMLTAVGLTGGAFAFAVGLRQYVKAQRWKRAEWVAQEVRSFFSDPKVALALQMIDWGGRKVRLFPDREGDEQYVYLSDDDVARALMHHSDRDKAFSEIEAAVRDVFDAFLDGLERFEQFIQAGLIEREDVRPYLAYWLYHIREAKHGDPDADRLVQLRTFIDSYSFVGVQRLFERFRDDPLLAARSLPAAQGIPSLASSPTRRRPLPHA